MVDPPPIYYCVNPLASASCSSLSGEGFSAWQPSSPLMREKDGGGSYQLFPRVRHFWNGVPGIRSRPAKYEKARVEENTREKSLAHQSACHGNCPGRRFASDSSVWSSESPRADRRA